MLLDANLLPHALSTALPETLPQALNEAWELKATTVSFLTRAGVVVLGGLIALKIAHFFLTQAERWTQTVRSRGGEPDRRITTLFGIFKSVTSAVALGLVILLLLNELGINTAPLLASAGILGAAVAFGTQSLVKDLFYGFLILAENQFAVGDLIQVGSTTGRVRQMTFRTVLITDEAGRLHYVPNGDLARVTVLPGGPVAEPVEWELGVPSGELDVVWETVERVCGELKDTAPAEPITLIEGPRVVFGEPVPTGGVRLRVKAKAALNTSWEVSRRFQELLVDALSEVSHEPVRLTLWVNQAAPVPGAPLAAAAAVRD